MRNSTAVQFKPLSEQQLMVNAPSIFTSTSAENTSSRYTHIPTIDVVRGLIKEGFQPVVAYQSNSRTLEKKLHTKHMLRFRHESQSEITKGGLFPELVLINSHDGLSSYKLQAGLFRLVCTNGLVAGETYEEVKVRHQGDITHNVIEGAFKIIDTTKELLLTSDHMSNIELNHDEKHIFAEAVHQLRFDNDESLLKDAIKAEQFIKPRRFQEHNKNDLFTVFNIAQENTIRGGLTGYTRDANNRLVRKSTREIRSIDQNNSLNRALWTLAEKMRELKSA